MKKSKIYFKNLIIITLLILCIGCTNTESPEPEPNFDPMVINNFGEFLKSELSAQNKSSANLENSSLSENQARELLNALVDQSMDFLLDLGYEKNFIIEELGDKDYPSLAEAAIAIYILSASEQDSQKSISVDKEFLSCLAKIIPIVTIAKIIDTGVDHYIEKHGKKALVKVVGKALGKTLSWVGMAISAYELTVCIKDSVLK